MSANPDYLTMGEVDVRRWETVNCERTVLAVVRTFTSAVRLLDALSLFGSDFRIGVQFAFDNSSAFSVGVPDLLRATGIPFAAWPDAIRPHFDLALMASENIELEHIDAPIVVLPHGTGFHRYVPDSAGPDDRLAGVVPTAQLTGKRISIAIPHPGQRDQLQTAYPEIAARCVVVGDMVFDQLTASLPLRDHYRQSLGVGSDQRLVVVTSTWGTGSLVHGWQELPARLLGELPADEYRVALVLHPNVWSWHGEYQVKLWLADARDAGLMVLPPSGGWQAALVAADAVVGDHGSVTLYGAALDRPVLLTGDLDAAKVVPGTPPDELASIAIRLDDARPLAGQVAAAIDAHEPGRFAALADRMFAKRGEAALALRDLLYDRLSLAVPDIGPTIRAADHPRPEQTGPRSFVVFSKIGPGREISLWRFPAAVRNAGVADPDAVRHLCVDEEEPDRRRPANASVIVRRTTTGHAEADAWIDSVFRRYPGCRVTAAATADGCLAGLTDGQRIHIAASRADPALAASAVYACLRAGEPARGPVTIRTGAGSFAALMTPLPDQGLSS
jgi:hypothetical protein